MEVGRSTFTPRSRNFERNVAVSTCCTGTSLRSAIADATPVWIGYADTDGTTTEQIIDPIRLGGGMVTAFDHRTEQVRSFMVARISGVAPLEDET